MVPQGLTSAGRLRVRRPREDDLGDVFRIHGDPRTNMNNPSGPDRDRDMSHKRLSEWLEHWEENGFGYWTVELAGTQIKDRPCRVVVGFAGVRHDTWLGTPVLNLYFRFSPEYWGRGDATEVASHAVAGAMFHHPHTPVLARPRPENLASPRTAEAAGRVRRHGPHLSGPAEGQAGHHGGRPPDGNPRMALDADHGHQQPPKDQLLNEPDRDAHHHDRRGQAKVDIGSCKAVRATHVREQWQSSPQHEHGHGIQE